MTPAEHKTQAESLLTAATAPRSQHQLSASDADHDVIQAHAHLGKAAGTGAHYTAAEAALAAAATAAPNGTLRQSYRESARAALAHAILADE